MDTWQISVAIPRQHDWHGGSDRIAVRSTGSLQLFLDERKKPCLVVVVVVADIGDRFYYSAIVRSRADSLRSHVIDLHVNSFFYSTLSIHRSGVLTALQWLVPHETVAVSARSVYTIQPCTMSLHAKPHT